jgi:hypothetical protein
MRRTKRTMAALLSAGVALGLASASYADTIQVCDAAYRQTQISRRAGKLLDARKQALACGASACPEADKTDCVKWLAELDANLPTVVFAVQDTAGADTLKVRVSVDGTALGETLDGKAVALDPGSHKLRFEIAGADAIEQNIVILEGQKNRRIEISFKKQEALPPSPPTMPAAPPTSPPSPGDEAPQRSVAPWVIGGVGLAGLAVGGILAGVVAAAKSTTENPMNCDPNLKVPMCYTAGPGLSAANRVRTLGPVSTVGFVVGGVGVGVAAVWLIARGSGKSAAPAPSVGMGPMVTTSSAGWRLQGSW